MPWTTTNTAKGDNKLYSDAKGVVPSLDLRFASQKNLNDYMTGTPLVDHQRSMSGSNLSPGTFVNSSGLIETAKVNLLAYSKDNLGWSTQDMNNDGAVEGPPGEGRATRFTSVGGTVASRIRYLSAFTTTAGVQYTLSIYVKPLNYNSVSFGLSNMGAGASRTDYNFSTGIVTNAVGTADASMEPVGNGWWRLKNTTVTVPVSGNLPTLFLDLGDTAAETHTTAEGFDVYGGQIEEGVDLNTYIQTIGLPSAAPRFDHDPTTGESLGLLIEESRTNLVTYSEQFEDASWGRAGTTSVTPNAAMAPDGSMTADQISLLSINSRISKFDLITTPGQAGTASIYIKNIDHVGSLTLRTNIVGGSAYSKFITLSNEWQRYDLTTVHNGTDNIGITIRETTSNPSGSFLVWGAQVEAGSFPTSYIPTTGTALTRSEDLTSLTGTDFSSWYNQTEGSFYVDIKAFGITGANVRIVGTNAVATPLYYNATGDTILAFGSSGGPSVGGLTPFTRHKAINSYAPQNEALDVNAGTVSTSTGGFNTASSTVNATTLFYYPTGAGRVNGTIRRLTYWPERLPDATLQAITAS